ncbi:hypothetical protein [Streptomyces gossypiisoli]|uniref:hypothetical protein n=1 Tax=Streptomyces gossypiisoli TaxID=2748864 RepID=UPI0015DA2874|nr:hypothetical protein [Streptomyces gossypiisoli]
MSTLWLILGIIVALALAVFALGMARGAIQAAREGVRRDLFALSHFRQTAEGMAKISQTTMYVLAPPNATGREHLFGWLWWRASVDETGQTDHAAGWALTYRRARKAAGLDVDWRSTGAELIMAPDRQPTTR